MISRWRGKLQYPHTHRVTVSWYHGCTIWLELSKPTWQRHSPILSLCAACSHSQAPTTQLSGWVCTNWEVMRYPSRTRLLILFLLFICCVALCQYIEATKFRDGARGKLASADEGNPPTTHSPPPPPLNLCSSSASTLQSLTYRTIFLLISQQPSFFCYSKFFRLFSAQGVGNVPFLFFAHSWFISSWFLPSSISLPSFSSSLTMSWCLTIAASVPLTHTHKSSAAFTGIAWSMFTLPPTLWMTFSVLPWCVHHFCFTLGSNQLSLCFLWLIILCVSLYLSLKLSESIMIF